VIGSQKSDRPPATPRAKVKTTHIAADQPRIRVPVMMVEGFEADHRIYYTGAAWWTNGNDGFSEHHLGPAELNDDELARNGRCGC
jgi:hypothetical protein